MNKQKGGNQMIRMSRRTALGALAGASAALSLPHVARANTPLKGLSHRQPSLEFYAKAISTAVPGSPVDMTLIPADKAVELQTLTLSQGSDAYDILWVNDTQLMKYAKNGWLQPIDDLWARYRAEFKLDDYPASVLDSYRYDGKLYAVPSSVNGMFYFYRQDLFDAKGYKPPSTFEEWLKIAEGLHSPAMSGAVVNLKRIDAALNEAHYYMNAFGDGWFDAKWKPIFNNDKGVAAIERLKSLTKFAQRAYASSANDEAMIAFQQGLGATGLQWFSRAGAMDDAQKSRVGGKIAWAVPPGGKQRIVVDGFAISKFSKQDRDLQFRILATAMNESNQRAIASDSIPSRASVLNDAELHKKFRHYPAALSAIQAGKAYPALPEFVECGDFITLRIQQALAGEMGVKQALDTAAREVSELLTKRGY